MKDPLNSAEWSLLAIFFTVLASFIFIAKVNVFRASDVVEKISNTQRQMLVTITGSVKKPGTYSVQEGATVEMALKKAKISPYADLSKMPLKEIIRAPIHLDVEELKEIKVFVEGAILEPKELIMPLGSRICDLKSKVTIINETEKKYFRRRKLLRNGDKIVVPKKMVEQN